MKKIIVTTNLVLLLLMMFSSHTLFCQVNPLIYTKNLMDEYKTTDNDSIKIERLFDLAFFYSDYLDDDKLADSLCNLAIQYAEGSHRPE